MKTPERESEWAILRARLFSRVPCIKGDQYHALKWIFNLAWDTHKDQERADGSPYWSHIRAIIDKLETLGIVDPMIWALVLGHDVFEDSDELKQRPRELYSSFCDRINDYICLNIKSDLGPELATRLLALTKPEIDGVEIRTEQERMNRYISNLEKIADISPETILVKMADRWHNLQTLDGFDEEKKREQCIETGAYMLSLFEETEVLFPGAHTLLHNEIMRSLDKNYPDWEWDTKYFLRTGELYRNWGENRSQEASTI